MNAPESAQIGRPNLKATRRNVDALSKVRQNWYVYFRDGAFTFARYAIFVHKKIKVLRVSKRPYPFRLRVRWTLCLIRVKSARVCTLYFTRSASVVASQASFT